MTPKQRKKRFEALSEMGCIVCRNQGYGWTPTEIHHLKGSPWSGMGKRASDEHTIPLCAVHHRHSAAGEIGFHDSPAEFREQYGSQADLLLQVDSEINGD